VRLVTRAMMLPSLPGALRFERPVPFGSGEALMVRPVRRPFCATAISAQRENSNIQAA
jgi:hypothetical protein